MSTHGHTPWHFHQRCLFSHTWVKGEAGWDTCFTLIAFSLSHTLCVCVGGWIDLYTLANEQHISVQSLFSHPQYILNEKEVKIKTDLWMQENADYLKEQKGDQQTHNILMPRVLFIYFFKLKWKPDYFCTVHCLNKYHSFIYLFIYLYFSTISLLLSLIHLFIWFMYSFEWNIIEKKQLSFEKWKQKPWVLSQRRLGTMDFVADHNGDRIDDDSLKPKRCLEAVPLTLL